MAGSVTMQHLRVASSITRCHLEWTSDASGVVSGNSTDHTWGSIIAVTFLPGSGGSAPTNLYDLTAVCDIHGVDILNDEGLNLSGTVGSHHAVFSYNADKSAYFRQFLHEGSFSLGITNAGNAKSGSLDVYISHGVV